MDKKEQILHYHRIDGLSQREIARRVGVSRKTVKRYITEYETLEQADPEEGINNIVKLTRKTCEIQIKSLPRSKFVIYLLQLLQLLQFQK